MWHPEIRYLLTATVFVVVGLLAGTLHFRLLQWQTLMLVQGVSAWRCLLLYLSRFALTAIALFAGASNGVVSLLAALVGILFARKILLSRARDN